MGAHPIFGLDMPLSATVCIGVSRRYDDTQSGCEPPHSEVTMVLHKEGARAKELREYGRPESASTERKDDGSAHNLALG
jgi:hypothetical protein